MAYDYRDQIDQNVNVWAYSSAFLRTGVMTPADDVAMISLGLSSTPGAPSITSFNASMGYLHFQSPTLTLDDKRSVLSVIGRQLANGYDDATKGNPDMESVFQNARSRGSHGGICGDIHTYLSQVAAELGFEAVGIHSGVWKEGITKSGEGGHWVAHFRDPATGEYYMQNYENLYATGQKTLPNLVEVSTRILGWAWSSSVNSLPEVSHQYIPRSGRWVSDRIEAQALAPLDQPYFTVDLTNREQSAGAQYGWAKPHHQLKCYALLSRFDADEGDYAFSTGGLSYTYSRSGRGSRLWFEEAGMRASVYAGALWIDTPILRPAPGQTKLGMVQWDTSNTELFGTSLMGYLRRGRTTATAEGQFSGSVSLPGERNEIRFGVEQEFKSVPLKIAFQRVWNVVGLQNEIHVDTAYDRLGAVCDLHSGDAITLRFSADGYALGGMENSGGSAARVGAEVAVRTRRAGTFMIGADWGKVLENTAKDPFYDLPESRYASAGWRLPVGRFASVGARMSYGEGPPTQPFGTFGAISPELNDGSRQIRCVASLNLAF